MANDRNSGNADNEIQDTDPERVPPTEDSSSRPPSAASTNSAKAPSDSHNVTARKEESSFSFKHFLRNSADSPGSSSSSNGATAKSTQPNLGARPKVPNYGLGGGGQQNGGDQQPLHHALPRMKRSPKFPSFDSHASLAEYSEDVAPNFVQRSHSNYEVETPASFSSSRRSPSIGGQRREPSLSNSPSSSSTGHNPTTTRTNSDFQAALPDFVKDHMVLEQWYQTNPFRGTAGGDANDLSPREDVDVEPLSRRTYHNSNLFDLAMGSGGPSSPRSFRLATNSPTIPLDLPSSNSHYDGSSSDRMPLDLPHHSSRFGGDRLGHPSNNSTNALGDIPLDLTDRHQVNPSRNENHHHSPPPAVQADMIQTLPDFLSDGPIHSSGRLADVAQDLPQLDSPEENATPNVISRLRLENDRLRHELDEARRLISDLERTCRTGEIQRNGTVIERNKLNQRIAQLTEENQSLRVENESLRDGGAVGGNCNVRGRSTARRSSQRMCQLLSMELKLAAGSAEANLRQLLAGVENLKVLARRVEDGMEDHGAYNSEDDDDDGAEEDFLGSGAGAGI